MRPNGTRCAIAGVPRDALNPLSFELHQPREPSEARQSPAGKLPSLSARLGLLTTPVSEDLGLPPYLSRPLTRRRRALSKPQVPSHWLHDAANVPKLVAGQIQFGDGEKAVGSVIYHVFCQGKTTPTVRSHLSGNH